MRRCVNINLFVFACAIIISNTGCKKINDLELNPTNGKTSAIFNSNVSYGTLTDQVGNIYKTVTIGTQTWMAENLRTTKYNDGTDILQITNNKYWSHLLTGAYCNYKNTKNIDTIATYGSLYNWNAVSTGKLAPVGWHVPSDEEWSTLMTYLGDNNQAGGKLKETGTIHWSDPNLGANNESGFTALPGGFRGGDDGTFINMGKVGMWWSSTGPLLAYYWSLTYDLSELFRIYFSKELGFSVRCVKD
jgi:uncharacterized protein (TIGR02145 family)